MGKGDGKWGKKGDGLGPGMGPMGPGAPGAWKGLAKWGGKGDRSEKGNWISQPEDGPELKRPRMDAMGPAFSLKGKDGGKGKGLAPGLGGFSGKGEVGHSVSRELHRAPGTA